MLDTGIDIPEVVNLLLFKPVRSKTKYWQMIGRGTRLRPNLFGPDDDKKEFLVFDVCGNLDYFGLNLPSREGRVMPPVGERVFRHRAELVHILDEQYPDAADADGEDPEASVAGLRAATAHRLHEEVQGMNRDNFVVRPKLEAVERFADFQAWKPPLTREALDAASELAGLPTGYRPEEDTSQEARRFDLLALQLQLAVLKHEPEFDRLRARAAETASLLLDQLSIPVVAEQVVLLEAVAGEDWWTDVTVPMLEQMRRRMRGLVRLIDRARRNPVYSDFIDKAGKLRETEVLGAAGGVDHKKFKERIRAYMHGHEDDPAVDKLRHNLPITAAELDHLTEVFVQIGIATPEDLEHATGADLVYLDETRNAVVLVQYKRLKDRAAGGGPG
jgi:type I restriction enzyme R subunit